ELGEMPERGADAAPGGIDAGEEQEERRAEHVRLGYRLAVDLSIKKIRDEVVFRVLLVLLDAVPEVEEDHPARLAPDLRVLQTELEEATPPVGERIRHLFRDAEHARDDDRQHLLSVTGIRVAAAHVN